MKKWLLGWSPRWRRVTYAFGIAFLVENVIDPYDVAWANILWRIILVNILYFGARWE